MTDLATTFSPTRQTTVADAPSQPTSTMAPTTLITEGEVRFGTAAAVALPPARTRGFGDVVHDALAKVRAAFAGSGKPPATRHYLKRRDFLEESRMARMMDRL